MIKKNGRRYLNELSEIFRGNGWLVYQCDAVDLDEMKHRFEE